MRAMPEITRDLDAAVARLRSGQLVALPTETVYGLAADAANPEAVAQVYALKRRPSHNPLIVHLAEAAAADAWAAELTDRAVRLMAAFWPGPLTLVVPARPDVPRTITAGQPTVALRQPDHPVALAVLQRFGGALVAPSANRYMGISPTTALHVAAQFAGEDLLIVEGGSCRVGLESTIVSLLPDAPARLLRPGMLSRERIEAILGEKLQDSAAGIRVPGQHRRHYAPTTPAWRFAGSDPGRRDAPRVGWLFCGEPFTVTGPRLDLGAAPDNYAQGLYEALYHLDQLDLTAIMVQLPPDTPAWLAVQDRLRRATAPLVD